MKNTVYLRIALLFLGPLCFGQTLTLQEAIGSAMANNEDIAMQENNLDMALYKVKEAYAGLLPTLEGFGQFQKRKGGQFIEQQAQFVNDALTDNFFGTFDADLTLFNGLKNHNSIKRSKHLREANSMALVRTKQDVVFQVSTAYLECLVNKELTLIQQNNLVAQQEILTKVDEEAQLGTRAEIDLLLQRTEVEKGQLALLRAQGDLKTAKLKLMGLIGMGPDSDFDIVEPFHLSNRLWDMEALDTVSIDYQKRPDYLQSNSAMDASKDEIRIQSSGLLPTLSAFYSYNSGYNSGFINDFSQQLNDNLLNEYGLRLRVPIFLGLKNRSARKKAAIDYDNKLLADRKLKRQIEQEVLQAVQDYKEALQEDKQTEIQLQYAERVYDLETERLMLGMSDVERYARATEDIVQSRSEKTQTHFKVLFQGLFLQYAMGVLSVEEV